MSQLRVKKSTAILFVLLFVGILASFLLFLPKSRNNTDGTVVSFEGDTQVITVAAKGGYFPSTVTAKANTKTVLRMVTKGTFDCSTAFAIPSIGYSEFLPSTGTTDIPIPEKKSGDTLIASCTMGMYGLKINFQ